MMRPSPRSVKPSKSGLILPWPAQIWATLYISPVNSTKHSPSINERARVENRIKLPPIAIWETFCGIRDYWMRRLSSAGEPLHLDLNSAEAHTNLANALLGIHQVAEAIASYRKAAAMAPQSAECQTNLGTALEQSGQMDEAMAAYRPELSLLQSPSTPRRIGIWPFSFWPAANSARAGMNWNGG